MRLAPPALALALCAGLLPVLVSGLVLAAGAGTAPVGGPLEVAITVDDLPSHPREPSGVPTSEVQRDLLRALARHRIKPVVGFVVGHMVEVDPESRLAVQDWVAAGHRIGNHTYTHLDQASVDLAEFLRDIDRNENVLAQLSGEWGPYPSWRLFRFPYLQEGRDARAHLAIREHLARHGYRVAPVTIDFADWLFSAPNARCAAAKHESGLRELRQLYRRYARETLGWADASARELFGRPIRHVLLVHATPFTAAMLDSLLTDYEKAGVRFVSLEDALLDPAYQIDSGFARPFGAPFLQQLLAARGAGVGRSSWPLEHLNSLCR